MSAMPTWAKGLNWIDCAETDDASGILGRLSGPRVCAVQTKGGEFYTVGEINEAGGTCNCCSALTYDPVVRYALLLPT